MEKRFATLDTPGLEERLNEIIVANPGDDEALYTLGRLYWKQGRHGEALTAYQRAVAINPHSPARHAIEMAHDVFNFFNPDLLNP